MSVDAIISHKKQKNKNISGDARRKTIPTMSAGLQARAGRTELMNHIPAANFNAYAGLRKGAATHATVCMSGTTAPPSIPSVARRGEWSFGSVLDVYWHFNSPKAKL